MATPKKLLGGTASRVVIDQNNSFLITYVLIGIETKNLTETQKAADCNTFIARITASYPMNSEALATLVAAYEIRDRANQSESDLRGRPKLVSTEMHTNETKIGVRSIDNQICKESLDLRW
ncbi:MULTISPECIES: hypothetical protein [unclassified Pseudomonas]|uniref:hypothetical protein n=1 Tax=unclassified Pseudomonas TaxID=196821 RepID=UPI0015A8E7E6|nr:MULTISPECIES: hypothetical protein [unclassified Pseudomonas]